MDGANATTVDRRVGHSANFSPRGGAFRSQSIPLGSFYGLRNSRRPPAQRTTPRVPALGVFWRFRLCRKDLRSLPATREFAVGHLAATMTRVWKARSVELSHSPDRSQHLVNNPVGGGVFVNGPFASEGFDEVVAGSLQVVPCVRLHVGP